MAISDTITSIEEHLLADYKSLNKMGVSAENQNIQNIAGLVDEIYNNAPKTSYQEGSNVTLQNCLKAKMDFEDYGGDTKQDSTNGYKLFNLNAVDTTQINIIGTEKEFTITQKNNITNIPLPTTFKANTQYTFSGYYSSTKANSSLRITYTDNTTENIVGVFTDAPVSKTSFSVTSNASKSISNVAFRIFGTNTDLTYYDFMIEEGSTAHSWEKYTRWYSSTKSFI